MALPLDKPDSEDSSRQENDYLPAKVHDVQVGFGNIFVIENIFDQFAFSIYKKRHQAIVSKYEIEFMLVQRPACDYKFADLC